MNRALLCSSSSQAEIASARLTPLHVLPDPEADTDRVIVPEWLVLVGECTHMGCIPVVGGDYGGYERWCCIVLCCIVLCYVVLYCIVLYCIVLYCIVLYCIVLYCIVLYCIVLYCVVLYVVT